MDKTTITISDKSCRIYASADPVFLLVQPTDDHELGLMDHEVETIRQAAGAPFILAAFRVDDWNQELSPWDAPAVFGKESFGHGAEDTLAFIENEFLPVLMKNFGIRENVPVILGGYSLAGLFSLWSGSRGILKLTAFWNGIREIISAILISGRPKPSHGA
jgi:enterochelin esterase-like enzyme